MWQVCMATENLFQRCRQHSKVAHGSVSNPLAQLTIIGHFVSDLVAILKDHRQQQRATAQTAATSGAG